MAWLNTLRLKSSNPQIRSKAVENLAGSTSKSDTERIFASLYDQSPQVRCAAVRALEKTDANDSVSSLISALRDECFEVREAAARSLGRMGNVTAASHLAISLKDADGAVRVAAACALRAIGWKPSTREELARFEIALGKTPVTISAGSAALDPLMADHKHDTTFQRREAADALRELNDPHYFRPVLAGLADPDPGNRIATIHSLGQVTHPEVTAEILKCFRDNDPDVRLAAAQMLSGRDDPSPVHFLGLLDDTNFEVRLAAVQFLGRIRNPQIAQVLIPVLADASVDVRQATAAALGRIGHASAIEGLVMCLTDEDRLVRQAAEQALQDIDPNWMRTDSASNAGGRLEVLLSVSPPWERLAIQQVLEKLRGPAPGNQSADQTETQVSVRV